MRFRLILCALLLVGAPAHEPRAGPPGPGDDKRGYEHADYVTRSRQVVVEHPTTLDLRRHALSPQPGLPPLPVPADNPLTDPGIALGRKLFFDRRLSANGTMSCAMCHVPEHGFTHNEMTTALGIGGRSLRRNAPTILNVGYLERLFHDGRERRLEDQVWAPLLAADEMGNASRTAVVERIASLPDYDGLFESALGEGPGPQAIGIALASFQRALVAADSPFDRWRYGGRDGALSESARRGFELFAGRAGCARCHSVGERFALFTDQDFHNTGIGYLAAMRPTPTEREIAVAPGETLRADTAGLESIGGGREPDLGLAEVTGLAADRWRYRTPSLRNVALTAPYMHDGSISSLEAVVRFYARGGAPNPGLDPLIEPLDLDERAVSDLVALLRSLTGGDVARLVEDARSAPVGGG